VISGWFKTRAMTTPAASTIRFSLTMGKGMPLAQGAEVG
jgi:hypothetical protein